MNNQSNDDPLDLLLHEEPDYIDDRGFTARVMAALPAPRPLTWIRPVLILGATLVSLAMMIWWVVEGGMAALASTTIGLPEILGVCGLGMMLVASIVLGVIASLDWET